MVAYRRRRVLTFGASLFGAGALAGCTGRLAPVDADVSTETTAQASFAVFGDIAAAVAGDTATAETLVPVGQHGHGWEPAPRIREAVLRADLFVYGLPGFQPWADLVVRDLREDEHDVAVVAAAEGVDLLEATEARVHDHAVESDDHADEEHSAEPDDPGPSREADPHFWLDPLRAKAAVDNVHDGFVRIDPDNTTAYRANAEASRDRLDELHDRFESTLTARSRDAVFVAGHNAFGYLHDRYGIEIQALTGLSSDDIPSPRDVERAQHLIAEHDLEYICADPLESQRAAEQLVDETDARAVLPLTAIPGRTEAWAESGWGYVDIMANVNLPTLERALVDR
jgi:zinc transport system substrate-binding protein